MGPRRRAKREAWDLPEAQRICIWCDVHTPKARSREHVLAEGLGGDREYRLPGGLVCDACNYGPLKNIDEQMLRLGPLCWLRVHFGLAPKAKNIAQGIDYDHEQNEYRIDANKLKNNNEVTFDPLRGVITTRIAGPSLHTLREHMTRGLHRIAYNVLAYHHGGAYVRSRYRFLRDLILDLDASRERAFVLDQEVILSSLHAHATQTPRRRWFSTAEIRNGHDGEPEIVRIAIGPAVFFVSVRVSTAPLRPIVASTTNAFVYAQIDPG